MKKIIGSFVILAIALTSCKKEFLTVPNPNSIDIAALSNRVGVQQLLIAAYHDLTGLTPRSQWWSTSGTNWMYGDITSGDAYRGGNNNPDDGLTVEHFQSQPSTKYIGDKWRAVYDGVSRSNAVILATNAAQDMTDEQKTLAIAEARFLRGHFHFEAKKMWNNVPYIDETVKDFKLSNKENIWPQIEADFQFAYDNLPGTQPFKGQPNKWAAACFLAKAYMFQQNYTQAKALLDLIIPASYGGHGNGTTAQGDAYILMPNYYDNFNAETENNSEQVFQINFSANDGSDGFDANIGEVANTPNIGGLSSYGDTWKQPSFNLVNSFKTDANGLPMLDTFNVTNMTNDMEVLATNFSYVPYQGTVDPRLDWTVSRRGVPFLDWADYTGVDANPGSDPAAVWVNDRTFGGPYLPVKNNFRASQADGILSDYYAQGYLLTSATNYSLIRFADVLLWAAECEVEVGDLNKAREFVNYVRDRAKTGETVPVISTQYSGMQPSANYFIDLYTAPWADQSEARKAVRQERRLELAMEGHRFFDLVRWGIAADYMKAYLQAETPRLPNDLNGVNFVAGKNEYFPIPQIEISLNPGGMIQNKGY